MPSTTPQKRPALSQGASPGGLICPTCNGDSFTERSSFKTSSEPLLGAESASVVVDLMNCTRCGADLPAVRGRRRYTLVGKEKLAALVADLEEAKRINFEMERLMETMGKRSHSLNVDIERTRARGEVSALEAKVEALESETDGLAARRDRLARTLEVMASRAPVI